MANKPQSSLSATDDEDFKLAVGKIEQYRILEGLYKKVCEEKSDLQTKLSALQQSSNKDSTVAPSGTGSSIRRSITQQILDAATNQPLEHPTEFYQVMEKDKNQEIAELQKKSEDAKKNLKKVQQEKDELSGQIQYLMTEMAEKDGCMKKLEQRFEETLTDGERRNRLEREQILRELAQKGAGSAWVVINPRKSPLESLEVQDEATIGTVELRSKIDELQRRITELLNHNEKWNTLCQELQAELDRVKGQLLQYQKAEGSVKHSLFEDLNLEMKRRKDAEEMSRKARKQVEELEAKVFQLEKQLEDKERQEMQMSMAAEELREKALLYEEQIRSYKEDFENEQRDHNITRGQLDSLKNQWTTIYKDLQAKTQQLVAMMQRMKVLEHDNMELQKQLDQASRDAQLIRDHHQQQQQQQQEQQQQLLLRTRTPSTGDVFWECQICTYHNQKGAVVCKMCAASRHHALLSEPKPFGKAPGFGELEEDGIACY